MTSQYEYDYGPKRGSGTLLGVVLAVLLGAAALGYFVHQARTGVAGRFASWVAGRPLTVVSAPDVVEKIQKLNRLETVVYSLDTVVEGEETSPVLPDALGADKLLMIVHGQSVAGIDLSKLDPESVRISEGPNGREIRLSLPKSEIFSTSLDESKCKVYARDTGLFVRADPNLETQVRQKAQVQLQQAALTDGILDAAARNARAEVTTMLQGLGFSRVELR